MSSFFADSMLGKLSRFLRFFGYNTIYRRNQSINKMLVTAQKEDRIILTQSKEVIRLCAKKDIDAIRLPTTSIQDQLKILIEDYNISFSFPPMKMRCSLCNGELVEKNKEDILNKIPERSAEHYDKFWECEECGKVYWVGSHWKDIKRILDEIEQ